jgi:RNA polymerase sigma-70 factor (sigma-E family)
MWSRGSACNQSGKRLVVVGVKHEEEFTSFVRDRGDALTRTARLLIPDRGEAEDALQTALMRLTRHWPLAAPEPYVRRILVNLARDRGRRRHLVPTPAAHEGHVQSVPDPADAHASQAFLEDLLLLLPSRQRCAVVLRVIDGLSEAETADAMRCSAGTVKSNLSRGLTRLRELLPEGVDHD